MRFRNSKNGLSLRDLSSHNRLLKIRTRSAPRLARRVVHGLHCVSPVLNPAPTLESVSLTRLWCYVQECRLRAFLHRHLFYSCSLLDSVSSSLSSPLALSLDAFEREYTLEERVGMGAMSGARRELEQGTRVEC